MRTDLTAAVPSQPDIPNSLNLSEDSAGSKTRFRDKV